MSIPNEANNRTETATIQSQCDRRLSRAARSILVHKTLPILKYYDGILDQSPTSSMSYTDKIDNYKTGILSLMNNPRTCLLNPNRDMYWHDENLHTTIPNSRRKQQHFTKNRKIHVCGLCGKKFISRYYLDYHVETKHKGEHVPRHTLHEICPAHEICSKLGHDTCSKQALNDEPYYASGIHSDNDDNVKNNLHSQRVKRKYQKEIYAEPCSHRNANIQACYTMVENCFEGNLGLVHDLKSLLCDSQSCYHQLHSIFNPIQSIHHGREHWDMHHDEMNSVGYPFIILTLAGGMYFIWEYVVKGRMQRKLRRKKKIIFNVKKLK